MKNIEYQQKAVAELVTKAIELLSLEGNRKKLIFKAPTGAGKTVMASEMLLRLNNELAMRSDVPFNEVAYIWVAPNKLHEQSYFKMKNFFSEGRELHPIVFDDLSHTGDVYINPGEILFVNWESINKNNAVITRETESSSSLYEITRRTQEEQGIPIIVIIDEEHMFAGKNSNKTEDVLKKIEPKVEIRISATPKTEKYDATVVVSRDEVIKAEMIKSGIVLNPSLNFNNPQGSLNQYLINFALEKREELADAYKALGVNINPLLLIQLPNDKDEELDDKDKNIREEVETYLNSFKNITTQNGKLAVWLSKEKTNLENIEDMDNMTEVLLFKQAIALGWDCPRAAVLLIFRKMESYTFTVQTVGRILRMPEQKHYTNDILNKGYVYTDLSEDQIKIVQDDMDYMGNFFAERRQNLRNVSLLSEYCERPSADRNRLGSDFKKCLSDVFKEEWFINNIQPSLFTLEELDGVEEVGEVDRTNQHYKNAQQVANKITLNVKNIKIEVVVDKEIKGDEENEIELKNDKKQYARTIQELNRTYIEYCAKMIGNQFEKVSIGTLGFVLKELMEEFFGLFETEAIKVILYHENKPKFTEVIKKALNRYGNILLERKQERIEKLYKQYEWEVPADRLYKEDSHEVCKDVKNHALNPFVELKKASNPEKNFTAYLESNTEYIDWWYKNGDSGKQHFAISYTNHNGDKALFYVDFIIRMKNGQIFLFDTKSKDSDIDAPAKHNALINYINSPENKGKNLKGGIIIEENENWKYSPLPIVNTTNLTGWECFYPNEYKN